MPIRLRFKFIIHNFLCHPSAQFFFILSIDLLYNKIYITVNRKIMNSKVYVIQEISGTRDGRPKINIIGAAKYGDFVFCLPEMAQIIFSPGPLIFKLRKILKDYTSEDYLLLTGDPAIIGVACSIVSDITNGRYKLLKWDKQEKRYYPIEINLYEKGKKDE